jgi:UDP-N-acetylglucosamine transferase subunit ALG13
MIFVTTGISGTPFDRLLRALDDIETDEELVVQHGPSVVRPVGATCISFLPFNRLSELIAISSTVITHGGAGSILIALTHGKRPIVVPRLPEYSEVVDDHQLVFARHLAQSGLATLAEQPNELSGILAARPQTELRRNGGNSRLAEELSGYLHSLRPDSPPHSGGGNEHEHPR